MAEEPFGGHPSPSLIPLPPHCHPDPFDFAQDKGQRRICAQLSHVKRYSPTVIPAGRK
jgi:hypothetical protein